MINRGQNSRLTGMRVWWRMIINPGWSDTCVTAESKWWCASRWHESVLPTSMPLTAWNKSMHVDLKMINNTDTFIELDMHSCGARFWHNCGPEDYPGSCDAHTKCYFNTRSVWLFDLKVNICKRLILLSNVIQKRMSSILSLVPHKSWFVFL